MPDPVLRLDPARLSVEPGGQVRTVVTVANTGPIVEGFRVDVVGAAAAWAEVLTPEISVYPRQETSVVVAFSPPAGSATSGEVPFGVRVVSLVEASASAVAEGDLEIGKVFGLQSKITPVNSAGRWSARHRIELTNWGNAPVRLRLVASDPDEKLGFLLTPEIIDVPLGGTAHARLKVRTRAPTLRGAPARLPFRVVGEPDPPLPPTGAQPGAPDPRRPLLDATFNQRPILSRGVVAAAGLVVVGAVALTGFALLRGGDKGSADGAGSGAPPTPVLLSAIRAGAGAMRLEWMPRARIDSYTIVVRDSTGAVFRPPDQVSGAQSAATVAKLDPATNYCFTMQAVRGKQPSADSNRKCQKTAGSTPSGSPSPEGSGDPSGSPTTGGSGPDGGPPSPSTSTSPGTGSGWVSIVAIISSDNAPAVEAQETALNKRGLPAGHADTVDHPELGLQDGLTVVFVGPFPSREAAAAACGKGITCPLPPPRQFSATPAAPASAGPA